MHLLIFLLPLAILFGCSRQLAGSTPQLEMPQVESLGTNPLGAFAGQGDPLRYLALGDSYTIGEAVQEADSWPNQLADRIRAAGYKLEDPQIVARSGWTADDLAAGLQQAEIEPPYDLVSLLIGANNQFRGFSLESYRQELAALLEQAVAYAGNRPDRVLVLSIPDWSMTPVGSRFDGDLVAGEIDAFNRVIIQEADRLGVRYIDITPISRNAEKDPGLVAADGLHPSGKMYGQWVPLVMEEALPALQE